MDLNKVVLTGRLVKNPEARFTPTGKRVAEFTIAVNEKYGETETAQFVPVQAWNGLGEIATSYARKGRRVAITGRLNISSWEVAPGEWRYFTRVIASEMVFLDNKPVEETIPGVEEITEDIPL
jgi:single-strand DNA-binding protein